MRSTPKTRVSLVGTVFMLLASMLVGLGQSEVAAQTTSGMLLDYAVIQQSNPNASSGYSLGIQAYASSGSQLHTLLVFDTADIPEGATIQYASVIFYVSQGNLQNAPHCAEITSSWDSGTTWSTRPSYSTTVDADMGSGPLQAGFYASCYFPGTTLVSDNSVTNVVLKGGDSAAAPNGQPAVFDPDYTYLQVGYTI